MVGSGANVCVSEEQMRSQPLRGPEGGRRGCGDKDIAYRVLQDLLDHVLCIVRDPLVDVIRRAERKYLGQKDSLAHIGVSSLDVALDPQRIRCEELDRRVLVAVADATHDALEILVHLRFISMLWRGAPRARTLGQTQVSTHPHTHTATRKRKSTHIHATYQVVFENLAHHIVRLTALGSTWQWGK